MSIQHELDHLDGKLFIDHLSFLNRRKAMNTWDEEKDKYPGLLRVLKPGDTDEPKNRTAAAHDPTDHHDAL